MVKARVTPRRFVSIPWPELAVAVLAVKISALIKKELEKSIIDRIFLDR